MVDKRFKFKKNQKLNRNDDILIPISSIIDSLVEIDKSFDEGYEGDTDCNDYAIVERDFEVIISYNE